MTNPVQLKRAMILAVTSGKGGVGKTNLTINVSVALARLGHRVAVFDADFGLGNVDVMLGLTPQLHAGHVLSGERPLADVLIEGPRGLQVLPAGSGVQSLTSLTPEQRSGFQHVLEEARASFDFIIIDTGPGLSNNVLEMLQLAHHVLLVTALDPRGTGGCVRAGESAVESRRAPTSVWWSIAWGQRRRTPGVPPDRSRRRTIPRPPPPLLRLHPAGSAVREAMLSQSPLVEHLPHSAASRCFRLLANRLATLNTGPGGVRLLPIAGLDGSGGGLAVRVTAVAVDYEARNRLVMAHVPLVKVLARAVWHSAFPEKSNSTN